MNLTELKNENIMHLGASPSNQIMHMYVTLLFYPETEVITILKLFSLPYFSLFSP